MESFGSSLRASLLFANEFDIDGIVYSSSFAHWNGDGEHVYEYILIGAAVGFGFTLFEEFIYGSGSVVSTVARIVIIAGHMIFGMIMAKHLSLARYHKAAGGGSAAGEYVKAIAIPMLIHTLFDAFTANNYLLNGEDATVEVIGAVLGIVAMIALFVLQIRVLVSFKKNAKTYCEMTFE